MPLTYDQLSSITEKKFLPKVVDNIFDSNPLLQRLRENGQYKTVDGGTSIIVPLEYAQTSSSGWYSGADQLDTADNDIGTGAEYAWKQAFANISILRSDELKNMGDAAKVDLVKTKTKNAEKTLADKLGTGLYSSGTDAKSIVGLGSMMSASNTIGGIAQSTYSWWRPAGLDTTTTTLTMSAMQACYNAASIGNDTPSVIMTTRANFNRYYGLLQPQQRFVDSKSANGGWSSLMFNGTPVIVDSHAATGYVYFLNEKYLHLMAHPQENFRFEPFTKPINQNLQVAKVYWMGAFGSSNLRMQSALTAIAA